MTARISVNGVGLLADPKGGIYWPERRLLAVADLHLEKGSSYARRGVLLPPYDTTATLDRLVVLLRRYRPRAVVCLGDSFHDREGALRMERLERDRLQRLVAAHEWHWVVGNHDAASAAALGGSPVEQLVAGALVFRHQPAGSALALGEVVGHFHPKAAVDSRAGRHTAPCFVTDGRRMVLPAFGAYTGGLDVLDPAIASLFGRSSFRVLLLGRDRLHLFGRAQLTAIAGGA